jgi:PKD repeat protein
MKRFYAHSVILLISFSGITARAQDDRIPGNPVMTPCSIRVYDSIRTARLPVLRLPEKCRNRVLPAIVDNSKNKYFPGILDQHMFMACQQYTGVAYTFAYEINRLRDKTGYLAENMYPPHYTWNFMNHGEQDGVSYFQSWDIIRQQGHMTLDQYGPDTLTGYRGWISGYDKYYQGMHNRLKKIYSIPLNTVEGILTMKNWLYDHLDGSPTGGLATFGAMSPYNLWQLPDTTPEGGKYFMGYWLGDAVHGMTLVGYNDSIRYDVNLDGKYTNDIDINNDGKITPTDWEIGGFIMANSYGTWWANEGFCYVMYSSMAYEYGMGGVWNHCATVVEPVADYEPSLTMKVDMTFDSRNKIGIKAGVSDTAHRYPMHMMDFPIFNFQGGDHYMLGVDTIAGNKTMEFGLDVTPLLSYVEPGKPSRFYMIIEENDSSGKASGTVNHLSFIDYTQGVNEMASTQENVPILKNNTSFLDATGTLNFDKVQITTTTLPAFSSSQPYNNQLAAAGGNPPYEWSLLKNFIQKETDTIFPLITQQALQQVSQFIPYSVVVLPFSFPFCGRSYDTLYVNSCGFVSFEPTQLPYYYLVDEEGMLRGARCISPAFSLNYTYPGGDYLWMESGQQSVTFRWKMRVYGHTASSEENFGLRIYPDGKFEFLYGDINNQHFTFKTYSGYSNGDDRCCNIAVNRNFNDLSNKSYSYRPIPSPAGISLSAEGMLSVSQADSSLIYSIPVRVTDKSNISSDKEFVLADGLLIRDELVSGRDNQLVTGTPAYMKLSVTNNGVLPLQAISLVLRSGETSIRITDSTATLASLAPGSTMTLENAFQFVLTHPCTDEYPVSFTVLASSGSRLWKKPVSYLVSAPVFYVTQPIVDDGDDGEIYPGEVLDLVAYVRNNGSAETSDATVELSSDEGWIEVLQQQVQSPGILEPYSGKNISFRVRASREAQLGSYAGIRYTVRSASSADMAFPFQLPIGRLPVGVVKLSTNSTTADTMNQVLTDLNIPHGSFTSLPGDLLLYSSLFLIDGTSYSGTHVITDDESARLCDYLDKGGKLYLEEGSNLWYSKKTAIHSYFNYTSKRSLFYFNGISGIPGTLGDGMNYRYTGTSNYTVYDFVPGDSATAIFRDCDSITKYYQIATDGPNYKTIGSILDFGCLNDSTGVSSKHILMQRYLDFFGLNLTGPHIFFHASKRSICKRDSVSFTDDSYDNISSWQWEFPGGKPFSSTLQNPRVKYDTAGSYDVKLVISDGVNTRILTKKNYITVNVCEGVQDRDNAIPFTIYPNPASDILTVEFRKCPDEPVHLTLCDITGRVVLQKTLDAGLSVRSVPVVVRDFSPGLYFIRLHSTGFDQTRKIVVR